MNSSDSTMPGAFRAILIGRVFEEVGPIDGHDMDTLVQVLENIRRDHEDGLLQKPVFLHIKTKKGYGYEPAQKASDKLHAVQPKFNVRGSIMLQRQSKTGAV